MEGDVFARLIRPALLALAVLGLAGSSGIAQAPGAIAGLVTDDNFTPEDPNDDRPLAWATITVREGGVVIGSGQTNPDGSYGVGGLLPGAYDIDCEATGYQGQTRRGIEVPAGSLTQVDFRLSR
jgi:hypothetical protein